MRTLKHLATLALILAATLSPRAATPGEPPRVDALKATNPSMILCVAPLGRYDKRLLRAAERGITYVYGFTVRRLPARVLPRAAYNAQRRRWRADRLLDHLRDEVLPGTGCHKIVGFTAEDISTTKPPHADWGILGLAELGGVAGVVSSHRTARALKPPHTRARRVVKVVNHEIGHLLGLPHLKNTTCLMNDAEGSVLTTDRESGLLCPQTVRWIEANTPHKIPRHERFEWDVVVR